VDRRPAAELLEVTGMFGHTGVSRTASFSILVLLCLSGSLQGFGGIKIIETKITQGVDYPDEPIVRMIKDIDQRLMDDLIVAYPYSDINGTDSGEVQIFWGEGNQMMDLRREKADIRIIGAPGWMLGATFESWDFDGNWNDLIIGCPGAGKVLLFDSLKLAIQNQGTLFTDDDANIALSVPGTVRFGCGLSAGDFTGEGRPDLMVLSDKNATVDPAVTLYLGGLSPDKGLTFPLPRQSVDDKTELAHLDMMDDGKEALVISAPDHASMRWLSVNVTETPILLDGADTDGVVRFTGSIASTGNTFGWNQADDGWDTSNPHEYDSKTGAASVRYNQATGNVKGDRSVGRVNQLQIELGGTNPTPGDDMSGAYGISFTVPPEMLIGANSIMLNFNYIYEDWGFENVERMWIKARFWDHDGTVTWLGRGMDGAPEADATNEVFTLRGQNGGGGNGINLNGNGRYSEEVLTLFDGPGSYYLDMGGKISQWTAAGECGAVGFDNVSMVVRQVSISFRTITGSGGLGENLHVQDTDLDGLDDLLVSSPQEGKVRIFKGADSYWSTVTGLHAENCNSTIEGTPGQMFGDSLAFMPQTKYCISPSILVTDPVNPDSGRNGTMYHFICPLQKGSTYISQARDIEHPPEGIAYLGIGAFYLGDRDADFYPEWRVLSWSEGGNLTVSRVDSSPYPPDLHLLSPRVGDEVYGTVEIRVMIGDHDGDNDPAKLKIYRSLDNRSWIYLGDIDRMEGDIAVKMWDTTKYENARNFLKFAMKDDFGLERVIYSNWVDILNHRTPTVELAYPVDGATLSNTVSITARTTIASGDNLTSPVNFFYSRNGVDWAFLANRTVQWHEPQFPGDEILSQEFIYELNTTTMEDGPIWFRFNATTDFGLGSEARNEDPAYIDNDYLPNVEILSLSSEQTVSGDVNVTYGITDRDENVLWPSLFQIRSGQMDWETVGELDENETFYLWDTSVHENGVYDLSIIVTDRSMHEVREVLKEVEIHNFYTPRIAFDQVGDGEVFREVVRLVAVISDRDFNIVEDGVSFQFRSGTAGVWELLEGTTLREPYSELIWDTWKMRNGRYDLKARVIDLDGLVGEVVLTDVLVDNFYAPKVYPYDVPYIGSMVSGVLTITFNVSDDEPVDGGKIVVEVFAKGSWEKLDEPEVKSDSPAFSPGGNVTYIVAWDTLEKGMGGLRRFPDYDGYHLRINVTDADGRTGSWQTPKSYTVRNDAGGGGGFFGGAGGRWMAAAIFFGMLFIVLIAFLLFFMFFAEGKRGREEPQAPPPLVIPPHPPPAPARPESPGAAEIFAPVTGIKEPQIAGPSPSELEEAFAAISMAQEPEPEKPVAPREMAAPRERPKTKQRPRSRPTMDLDSVMPKKAMPKKLRSEDWDEDVEELEEWEE
jgi:hypothetical protein